jgi:replicative DNA helicase
MPLIKLSDAITQTIAEVSERVKAGGVNVVGLETGFPALDHMLGGLRRKAVYFLGGRPGMGKTSLALAIAMENAKQKRKVLFLSLEMDASLLSLRVLSSLTGIPAERIERGKLTKDEFEAVQKVVADTKKLTFGILDESITSEEFVDYVAEFQQTHGLDLLVIDYVSLFRDKISYGENERVSRISNNMMQIAKSCDIPVLLLGQLNREVEKRENHVPILSDMRDSGSIEQDSFCVMFCYRPYYYEMMFDGGEPQEVEKDAKIIVAKHRQGEVGQVGAWFYPSRTMWTPKETHITPPEPTGLGPLAAMVRNGR